LQGQAPDSTGPETSTTEPEQTEAVSKPIPYRQVLKNPEVKVLVGSRAASKIGQSTMSYGSMVHLAQIGATQFQISLVNSANYLAPLLFGLQGGTVADTVSKRLALVFGFTVQAALCFIIPSLFGTGVGALMFLMFLTSLLMQVITPGLKSAVAIVAAPSELASVSAIISLIGSIASAIGSSLIAPILIKQSGINAVLYVSGVFFAFGAIRALKMPTEEGRPAFAMLKKIDWRPRALSVRQTATWVYENQAIGTMLFNGAIVVALFESFNTLMPLYVLDVLHTDPANSVYIFAPAGLGYLVGTVFAPKIIYKWGARKLAVVALVCMSIGMMLFGFINAVAPIVAPISPLRLVEIFGINLSDQVLAASAIAIPLNFGSTASGMAIDNFINRRVAVLEQGAMFGFKEVQENALTLIMVLLLGLVSNAVGPQAVMVVAPIIAVTLVLSLFRYSFRRAGEPLISRREALDLLTTGKATLEAAK